MEILCKAKAECCDKWIYGVPIKYNINTDKYMMIHEYNATLKLDAIIPETTSCYTGITDRNNVKIFENDIVKTKYGRLCKVIWFSSPSYQGWDLLPIESEHEKPSERDLWNNLEVVGNVFDNCTE